MGVGLRADVSHPTQGPPGHVGWRGGVGFEVGDGIAPEAICPVETVPSLQPWLAGAGGAWVGPGGSETWGNGKLGDGARLLICRTLAEREDEASVDGPDVAVKAGKPSTHEHPLWPSSGLGPGPHRGQGDPSVSVPPPISANAALAEDPL